jgi:hypothetical protein
LVLGTVVVALEDEEAASVAVSAYVAVAASTASGIGQPTASFAP